MLNLGWAKAKMKENNEWTFGYVFQHDKFGDGSEINTYLVSTADGDFLQERQVDFRMVWEETVCHDTMWFADGNPIFVGDRLERNEERGIVVWDDNYNSFQVEGDKNIWDLCDYEYATIVGNIYDDFVPVEVVPSSITTEDVVKEIGGE